MKKIICIILIVLSASLAFSQTEGIDHAMIAIWQGGEEDVFYSETDFNGLDLGVLNSESDLYLKSGQLFVWKDVGGDIVDADMYYRIYEIGEAPEDFTNVNLPWHSEWDDLGITNQLWWNDSPDEIDLNMLEGLTDGEYIIEVYFQAENGEAEILYLNNATQNFKATFTFSSTTNIAAPRGVKTKAYEAYPNPATDKLNIKFQNQTNVENIKMINCNSEIIYHVGKLRGASDSPIDIPIESLDAGTYFLRVESDNGVEVQRIIILK